MQIDDFEIRESPAGLILLRLHAIGLTADFSIPTAIAEKLARRLEAALDRIKYLQKM